jgi:uncharacterized lipoprotein YmbA
MTWQCAILPVAVLLLASCGTSPTTHYYALAAAPGTAQARSSISSPVTVAEVQVPPTLDRREMVRRTGANTMEISDQDRWTAPLAEMIRRVLTQDLAMRLPKDKIVLPDAPAPPGTAQIVVSIAQFGPNANGKTTLDGSWSLLEGDPGKPRFRRSVTFETNSPGSGASDQAAAMSALLGQLAASIASTLAEPG